MPTKNLYLSDEVYSKLVHIAREEDRKVTALIQDAVEEWLAGRGE